MAEQRELNLILRLKDEASKTLKGLDDNLKALEKPFKALSTVGAVAFGALSVGIATAVKGSSEFESIKISFERLAQDLGASGDVILNKLNEVSKGTISNKDLMLSVNKAVALGVGNNMEDIASLLEIARVKGQALGVDTTQAFNDIVTGIGRGSPLILDNLGIITKGWAKEAEATGQAMDAQFIMNKILSDGAVELANIGEVALTPQERMAQLTKQFSDLSATMGSAFMPIVISVYEAILPIVTSFGEWIKNNQELFKNIVLVVGGITAFMAVAYPLIKVVRTAIDVIRALQIITALFNATLLANPITWVIAGIVALITIGVLLYKNWETISQKAQEIFGVIADFISEKFNAIKDTISNVLNTVSNIVSGTWEAIKQIFTFALSLIAGLVIMYFNAMGVDILAVLQSIQMTIQFAWDFIKTIFETAMLLLTEWWGIFWDGLSTKMGATWNFIKEVIGGAWNWITEIFKKAVAPINEVWNNLWDGMKNVMDASWEVIKSAIKASINYIIDQINKVIDAVNKVVQAGAGGLGISIPDIPKIPRLAKGGIVNKPTIAMIGEAGPEAVVPLKGNNAISGTTVNIVVNGDVSGRELVENIKQALMRDLRMDTKFSL